MRNVCWLKAGLRLGLGLLLLGGVSACSLEKPVRMTTIRVDTEALARDYDRQKQYEKDGPAIQQGPDGGNAIPGARLPVPSDFSQFSCLGINVTGPAIPNRPMPNGMAFCPWYSPKAFSERYPPVLALSSVNVSATARVQ